MSAKRTCSQCNKNRSVTDSRGRAVFSPRGRVCVHCQKATTARNAKNARLQKLYGITIEDYELLFKAQGGKCYICKGTRREALSVDHCHKTLLVRGLLCRMCNGRLLTAARDNPETLRKAAEYLESPPALNVLGPRYTPKQEKTWTAKRTRTTTRKRSATRR